MAERRREHWSTSAGRRHRDFRGAGCSPTPVTDDQPTRRHRISASRHYTLDNGLQVILRQDDRVPIAAVNLWYHVGPANEAPGRTGFAHLFEHMMFQGSGHTGPDAHFAHLESVGATTSTAPPSFDRHQLHRGRARRTRWSWRCGWRATGWASCSTRWTRSSCPTSRAWSATSAGRAPSRRPYGLSNEALYQLLFPEGHPYRAGDHRLARGHPGGQLADVRDFFARYYVPNNASLAIVGNIDIAATKALVEKYFGSIPRGPDVPEPQVAIPR